MMKWHRKILVKVGLFFLLAFVLSMFIVNPFIPDVCTSKGYGYPFPVYISWCECFINKQPSSVQYFYIVFDFGIWVAGWLWLSKILSEHSNQLTTTVPKSE